MAKYSIYYSINQLKKVQMSEINVKDKGLTLISIATKQSF